MIAELLDVRNMIEPPLAGRAALHVSRDEIADMEEHSCTPRGEGARGRTRNRRGLRVSLQHRSGVQQQRGLESGGRVDGFVARDPGTLVAGGRTARKVACRSSPNSFRSEAGRRGSRRGCHAPASAGSRKHSTEEAVKERMEVAKWASYLRLKSSTEGSFKRPWPRT